MTEEVKKLSQKLIDLNKKAEELDEILKNARSEIHNMFWTLIELKTNST